ncbi:alpha/beta fold hydrolase [Mycoplasmoides pirum]|uniref:alpha/beta fold hydrolase n=1 Tax=Mycoplasmoides pirum TaxID=2122 RepID=UPI0004846C97|nr:alpha/beta hydrolase [Mycoplasmoides pirum]
MLTNIEKFEKKTFNSKGTFFYLHSFMGNFQMKNSFFNYYKDYDIYAINLPGHGNSKLNNIEEIKVSYCINLVKKYIEDLNLKNLILFGHSLGGGIIAALNQLIPERIKLNIFEAPANSVMLENLEVIKKLIPNNINDTKFIIEQMYFDPIKTFGSRLNYVIESEYKRCIEKFKIFANNFKKETVIYNTTLFDNGFKNIKKPSLVILGEKDGILPTNLMLKHLSNMNNNHLKLFIVAKSGHAIYSEQKFEFLKLIDGFLNKNNER